MANELELKAVVTDPPALREALRRAGARETFRGMLRDCRLDRGDELLRADQVLRVRRWIPVEGPEVAQVGWKGPTGVSAEGFKEREEIEYVAGDGSAALRVLEALGFRPSQEIDRHVEVYDLTGTVVRIEWYPRMDVLVEIEGEAAGIEAAVSAMHLPRGSCLPEALPLFAARFEQRTGTRAVLAEQELHGTAPSWRTA